VKTVSLSADILAWQKNLQARQPEIYQAMLDLMKSRTFRQPTEEGRENIWKAAYVLFLVAPERHIRTRVSQQIIKDFLAKRIRFVQEPYAKWKKWVEREVEVNHVDVDPFLLHCIHTFCQQLMNLLYLGRSDIPILRTT
jgi:hypothetical protein